MKIGYVYILGSNSKKLYVGVTNDIERRIKEHKAGLNDGYAKKNGCTQLLYFERIEGMMNAINREKQIKRWRREKKIYLIELENKNWYDLSANW
jgi:putative endonuclease